MYVAQLTIRLQKENLCELLAAVNNLSISLSARAFLDSLCIIIHARLSVASSLLALTFYSLTNFLENINDNKEKTTDYFDIYI